MVHDHKLATVLLAGLLVAVLAGVGATTGLESRQEAAGNQTTATVTVSGVGEASAEPDRALVFVAATATGDSSSAAAARLAANTSDLRAALEDDDRVERVRTTGYQLFQQRENGTTTYVARQSFEVEVADTGAAGEVVDLAVGAGATEIEGVAFALSRERKRELRATAIDRAVADARADAEAVAASADLSLGGIRAVSTVDRGVGPVRETAADEGTVVDPGPVTVTAGVEITYNATAD